MRPDHRPVQLRKFLSLFCCAVTVLPFRAAAQTPIPDFSGVWGRDSVTFESPDKGPGPVVSRTHRVDALAGDYTNPVTYRKAAGGWPETVCAENTRDFTARNGETNVPEARTPISEVRAPSPPSS